MIDLFIAQIIETAEKAQSLTIEGMLIVALLSVVSVLVYIFKTGETNRKDYTASLIAIQKESVQALTLVNSSINSNSDALKTNSELLARVIENQIRELACKSQ